MVMNGRNCFKFYLVVLTSVANLPSTLRTLRIMNFYCDVAILWLELTYFMNFKDDIIYVVALC
jgi:hypothetical protein